MKRVFAHIGITMAISMVALCLIGIEATIVVAICLSVVLIASFVIPNIKHRLAISLCLGAALFSCLVFTANYTINVAPQQRLVGDKANISFYYVDIPQESDNGYSYIVKTVNNDKSIKLKINTKQKLDVEPYQIVNADVEYKSIADNAFKSYGYYGKGIYLVGTAESCKATNKYVSSPFKWLYDLRLDIINTLSNTFLDKDVGAIASGLITGYRDDISSSLYSSFKLAGVVHLMAVSGLHLTVMVGLLIKLLKRFNLKDVYIAIIGILTIIACVGLAGFSKSATRAGIMLSIMLIARAVNQTADSFNSLGLAGSLICLNPYAVTDVGFQLSFVATLSIILFSPQLNNVKNKRILSTLAIPWIVAFSTLPISYLTFGYVSLAGLIANAIITPLAPLAIIFSILSYASIRIGFLSSVFAIITSNLIDVIIRLVSFFAGFRYSVVSLPSEFIVFIIGAFMLILVAMIFNKRKWLKPMTVFAMLLVVSGVVLAIVSNMNSANVLITKGGACAVVYGDEAYASRVGSRADYYSVKAFMLSNGIDYDEIEQSELGCEYLINDVKISIGGSENADIYVDKDYIVDNGRYIDLSKGDVIYRINQNSTYEASWADI